jgi:hypothetical protein
MQTHELTSSTKAEDTSIQNYGLRSLLLNGVFL